MSKTKEEKLLQVVNLSPDESWIESRMENEKKS